MATGQDESTPPFWTDSRRRRPVIIVVVVVTGTPHGHRAERTIDSRTKVKQLNAKYTKETKQRARRRRHFIDSPRGPENAWKSECSPAAMHSSSSTLMHPDRVNDWRQLAQIERQHNKVEEGISTSRLGLSTFTSAWSGRKTKSLINSSRKRKQNPAAQTGMGKLKPVMRTKTTERV